MRREFGRTVAVRDVALEVETGAVLALVGPNGAGKTTLLKMICGLLQPTRGTAWVGGCDIRTQPLAVQQLLGFLPDFFGLYEELTVREYLDYFARAYRLPAQERPARIERVLRQAQLAGKLDEPVQGLSRGMRQRLAIARTLIHQPPLLLLDEPASGLDPESRRDLQALFVELAREGKTLVVSSHILSELEDYCTHVAILHGGRLVASGSLAEVRARLGVGRRVRISVVGPWDQAEALLRQDVALSGLQPEGQGRVFFFNGGDEALAALLRRLVHAGVWVSGFAEERRTIEETYRALLQGRPST